MNRPNSNLDGKKIKFKKLQINNTLRNIIIAFLAIVTVVLIYGINREPKTQGYQDKKVKLYNYTQATQINYKVLLKPNSLYATKFLNQDKTYISAFVDHLQADFKYRFKGENKAQISGTYEILGLVEGFTGEKDANKTIWQKEFILMPVTKISSQQPDLSIIKSIPIDYNLYNRFAENIIKSSKIESTVRLQVMMKVNLKAITSKGVILEKATPTMELPLKTSFFNVAKKQEGIRTGAIEDTQKVQITKDNKLATLFSVILVLVFLGLLFILIFTTGARETNKYVSKLNKIFKNHGDRLVALNNDVIDTSKKTFAVKSIDDLVRIADEISKPILYKYSPNPSEINEFYVIDDSCIYIFNLKEAVQRDYLKDRDFNKSSDNTTSI